MPSPMQRRGGLAEDQAVLLLRAKGYEILDRHVTSRYGEIDVLARDGKTIVAVEVKARRTTRFGQAIESLTKQKMSRLVLTLQQVVNDRGWTDQLLRIDVITIDGDLVNHLRGVSAE